MAEAAFYGIDAPGVRRGMAMAGLGGTLVGVLAAILATRQAGPVLIAAALVAGLAALIALYGVGMAGYMTYASRVGKLRTRERLLDAAQALVPWTGREAVLDVGCGRGLMVIGAARRLTSGRAVGIDLWRTEDQADNTPDATLQNARLEGVADRIVIETGDACDLPFADRSFDVVLSHWVVHNIPRPADRARALDEMLRVLRPDGVIVLADIAHMAEYDRHLRTRGLSHIEFQAGGIEAAVMGILSGGTFRPQSLVGCRKSPGGVARGVGLPGGTGRAISERP